MGDAPPYLGVEASILNRRWTEPGEDVERIGAAIAQAIEAPEIVGRVLAARGVAPDQARDYLNPTLRDLTPDPSSLKDMDVAATRLAEAARKGEKTVELSDGSVGMVPEDWLESWGLLELLLGKQGATADGVRVPRSQAWLLDALLAEAVGVVFEEYVDEHGLGEIA
ncbi:MAG: hypothetical protein AAFU55_17195, partial [Pseudomonadota bacterium]